MQIKKESIKKVSTVVVGIVLVISCITAVISGILHFCLLNKEFYLNNIIDDKYLNDVKLYAVQDVKEEAVFYGIDTDSMVNCIDDEKIKKLSFEYIEGLYLFFDGKAELPEVYYPDDDFYKVINEHYTAMGDINEQEDREIARVFAGRVENNINSMSNLTIITNIFKSRFAGVVRSFTNAFWVIIVFTLALFALYVYLKRTSYIEWARSSVGILSVATIFTFVPVWCLKMFDMPSKLILMDSPLKTLLDSLIYKSVDKVFVLLLIITVVVTVVLIVLSILRGRELGDSTKKKTKHRKHHSYNTNLVFYDKNDKKKNDEA
ncbi:MAG: hypothetical protein IJ462_04150 [Clostridia bacterium]|nr:hypothetical protein [Clostridia bacterium]